MAFKKCENTATMTPFKIFKRTIFAQPKCVYDGTKQRYAKDTTACLGAPHAHHHHQQQQQQPQPQAQQQPAGIRNPYGIADVRSSTINDEVTKVSHVVHQRRPVSSQPDGIPGRDVT